MAEMITLYVNGEEVAVEAGKNLIDAIGAVGIEIPHLCYHPALGADGNCRLCLVGIEDGRPPLVPACKTPATEGMRVLLDTEKIKKIQRDIMELELVNHPLDCPVCDQAGECKLQDYYMRYDALSSRVKVTKVAKEKKLDFGCGVIHDQERCVVCGRKITGTGELGIVNRTDQARVAIFPGRPLNNEYALNVVDLCPGRLSYRKEQEKRLEYAMVKGRKTSHDKAVERAQSIVRQASRIMVLLSPNLCLEHVVAAQDFATAHAAALSGYSSAYIRSGEGDSLLREEDKAANRRGLSLMAVDMEEAFFWENLKQADLLVCVGHDLRGIEAGALRKWLKDSQVIYLSTHLDAWCEASAVALPMASWSEYDGIVVNSLALGQSFCRAIEPRTPILEASRILQLLGGVQYDRQEILARLNRENGPLAGAVNRLLAGESVKVYHQNRKEGFGAFVPLCFIAVLVWMERRGAAFFQDRAGPNRANIFGFRAAGLVQNLADAVKLIFKEDVVPGHIKHKVYFVFAPVIVFFTAVVSFGVVPFADDLGGLLFGFIPMWGVFLQPLGVIIFVVAAFAETNRTPFDLAEGESELVAGFHVEYSAMKFAIFFMGEYVAMFTSSAIIVTLFFGGYQIPWLNTQTLIAYAKPLAFLFLSLLCVLLSHSGGAFAHIFVAKLQVATFLLKTTFMCFVYVWVRWTLPRF
ncbi:unnamed protein product, partial [Cyprideis torosa]